MLYRVLLLLIALISTQSIADEIQTYMGLETGVKRIKVKECDWTIRNLHPHLSFITGLKLTPYIGVEAGGHVTKRKSTSLAKIDSRGLHFAVLGYYPFIKNSSLLGGVGLSHVTTTVQNGYVFEMQKALPRLMCGIEIPIVDTMSFRATTAWDSYFKKKGIQHRNIMLYNLGFLYYY